MFFCNKPLLVIVFSCSGNMRTSSNIFILLKSVEMILKNLNV